MVQNYGFENSVSILKESGLWERLTWSGSDFQTRFQTLLPVDPIKRELCQKMVCALEVIATQQLRWSASLAVICFELKRASDRPLSEVALAIDQVTGHAFTTSYVSRLIKIGELLCEFPMLADIKDTTRLTILRKIPESNKREIYTSGQLTPHVNIRTASRMQLTTAIAAFHGLPVEDETKSAFAKTLHKAMTLLSRVVESSDQDAIGISNWADIKHDVEALIDRVCKAIYQLDTI